LPWLGSPRLLTYSTSTSAQGMREAMTTQRLSGLSRPPKGRKNSSGMINWLALCSYMRQPPDKKFVDYYSKLLCTSFRTKEAETFYLQGFSIYSVDPTYPVFNSPHEVGDVLKEAGVNIVSIANNHTLDRGEEAI